MKRPNTFIVGAPKCGTTSLASYLAAHPAAFFSDPKEVNYFNTDDAERHRRKFHGGTLIDSDDRYLEVFRGASAEHRIVAEGTIWYMSSAVAVPALLRFEPAARVIAMLRNPIDMAPSLHAQQLLFFNEDEPDFQTAWALQDERKRGRRLPRRCLEPRYLQYRDVCRLGEQAERLAAIVPPAQLHYVLFDDLVSDPGRVWSQVLEFLGLEHDGRSRFPAQSERRAHRIASLNYLLLGRAPAWLARAAAALKRALGVRTLGVRPLLVKHNLRRVDRRPLSPELRQTLLAAFDDDIRKLEALLRRDLAPWRDPQSAAGGRAPR